MQGLVAITRNTELALFAACRATGLSLDQLEAEYRKELKTYDDKHLCETLKQNSKLKRDMAVWVGLARTELSRLLTVNVNGVWQPERSEYGKCVRETRRLGFKGACGGRIDMFFVLMNYLAGEEEGRKTKFAELDKKWLRDAVVKILTGHERMIDCYQPCETCHKASRIEYRLC